MLAESLGGGGLGNSYASEATKAAAALAGKWPKEGRGRGRSRVKVRVRVRFEVRVRG